MTAPIDAPLIEAKGLHVFYQESHVLHGVDFSVGEGETVALMGRNGMGKTTLLKSLLGIVAPRRGPGNEEHGDRSAHHGLRHARPLRRRDEGSHPRHRPGRAFPAARSFSPPYPWPVLRCVSDSSRSRIAS